MKKLYEFNFDCGRQGELSGRFLATDDEIKNLIGKEANFGEVLGKHSDIYGEIEEDEISLVTDDVKFLEMAEKLNIDLETGYNPLEYVDN